MSLHRVYLVGGAVRDQLLNLEVKDRDWVVLGSTPEQMLSYGYKQVGADFPVFLHPTSGEEYALARTDRKNGKGYGGFAVDFGVSVTLEDDLYRRDLTINAMALDSNNQIIDPFNGQKDLTDRVFRHVSEAFAEDPLRVLRVARFMARYGHLGFKVAKETLALMSHIVETKEIINLTAERVWKETEKALSEPSPALFFETLRACGALKVVYPEVDNLYGVPQSPQHHPEVCTGIHTMLVLERVCELTACPATRFAALCHDLGKAETEESVLPQHILHEERGAKLVEQLCKRYKVPKAFKELATMTARFHTGCHKIESYQSKTIVKFLEKLDAIRRPERFEKFLLACEADAQGRTGLEHQKYNQVDVLRDALQACKSVAMEPLLREGHRGKELAQVIYRERVRLVVQSRKELRVSLIRTKLLK